MKSTPSPIPRFLTAAAVLSAALTVLAAPAFADQLVPTGMEEQINAYTTADQGFPEIATRSDGGFVVAWETFGQDGDDWGVAARLLAPDGTPVGADFIVPSTTADMQWEPVVAADGQGRFVVAWQSYSDVSDFDVRAKLFDSAGVAVGGELQVNSFTAGYQGNASVAASDAGDFLVVWESDAQDLSDGGVYGQLYDSAGQAIGDELQIHDTTAADQNDARVVAVDGGYVVTWESFLQDGSEDAVVMRFLGSDGSPASAEIVVNGFTAGSQEDPAVAVAADGTLAVVWESDDQDGAGEGIVARVFDSSGVALGGEMQLNTYTTLDQKNPRVAPDGTGGFVAVWVSEEQLDGMSEEIYGQRFDAAGLLGGEFQVNTQATDDQDVPSMAGGAGGGFQVVWRSFGGHDGEAAGVFGQRFEIALFADGFESGDTSAWSSSSP